MELPNRSTAAWPALLGLLGAMMILSACQSSKSPPVMSPGQMGVRNNAASLLYDLLGDEKDVSKLLIIKRDRRELHDVIKRVATTAGTARDSLEKLAHADITLNLKVTALPPGEQAARASESEARARELLHASGADLEFKLLLTQAEALGYAGHLAKVAAENEPSPALAKSFREISAQMNARHDEVLNLLLAPAAK